MSPIDPRHVALLASTALVGLTLGACAPSVVLPDGTALTCPADARLAGGRPDDDAALCVDTDGRRHGPFATWWPGGDTLLATGAWHHGRRDGTWRVHHADGSLAAEMRFDDGLPGGPWRQLDPDGQRFFAGEFVEGRATQSTLVVDPHDGARLEATLDGGQLAGQVVATLADGQRLDAAFDGGRPHGRWTLTGTATAGTVAPRVEVDFADGLAHGRARVYGTDGTVASEAHFEHGRRAGQWRWTLPDGHTASGAYDASGLRTGPWVERDAGDQIVSETTYLEGLPVTGPGLAQAVWIDDTRDAAAERIVELLERVEGIEVDGAQLAAALCALGAPSGCRDAWRALNTGGSSTGRALLVQTGVAALYDDGERQHPGWLQLACDEGDAEACAALAEHLEPPTARHFEVFCARFAEQCPDLGVQLGGGLERELAVRACAHDGDAGCRWIRDHLVANAWAPSGEPVAVDVLGALCNEGGVEHRAAACFHLALELPPGSPRILEIDDALCARDLQVGCLNAAVERRELGLDAAVAAERFARACELGSEPACEAAVDVIAELEVEARAAALTVLERACEGEHTTACAVLESLWREGRGRVAADADRAVRAHARLVDACREHAFDPGCTPEVLDEAFSSEAAATAREGDLVDPTTADESPASSPPVWGLVDEEAARALVVEVYREMGVEGLDEVDLVLDDDVLVPFYDPMASAMVAPRFLSGGESGMREHLSMFSQQAALGALALRAALPDDEAREAYVAFMIVAVAHELGHHLQTVSGEGGLDPLELELGAIEHELDWLLQAVVGGHLPAGFVEAYLRFNGELLDALDGHALELEPAVTAFDATYRRFLLGLREAQRLGTTPWPMSASATMVVYTRARLQGAAERALATCAGTRCRSRR